jgi:HSP20 family protein
MEDQFSQTVSPLQALTIESMLNGYYTPITDVYETQECIVIDIELPGIKNDDIIIEIGNGTLDIRGEHIEPTMHRSLSIQKIRRERVFGKFKKSVMIPYDVSNHDIRASFKDGILTIEIPKPKQKMSNKKQKVRLT